MTGKHTTFWEKLARLISGNATPEDQTWIKNEQIREKELENAFQQAGKVWHKTALPPDTYEPDVESGWQRFRLRVQTREAMQPKVRKMPAATMWGIAASVALVIFAGWYFLIRQSVSENWTQVQTAANETKTIMLADGSKVSLNQNSTFAYPADFKKENRTVKLTGEAFFEVAKAEGKRFTIFAQNTKTEVIGTSFNLRAYKDAEVKVQVVTGKVAFARTGTEEAIFLEPGQEGVLTETTTVPKKQAIKEENFKAWQTRNLVFTDQNLEQLATELEHYFNIDIQIQNDQLKNCRFTTSFENPELEEVLETISLTGNLKITRKDSVYIITGQGCK